ncbi:MAG TPA: hypothetical protein VK250_04440 [Nitrososphaeraceae archaeon]|nr:hypothetical protein [Nitrososphaeraceae archaeon]
MTVTGIFNSYHLRELTSNQSRKNSRCSKKTNHDLTRKKIANIEITSKNRKLTLATDKGGL